MDEGIGSTSVKESPASRWSMDMRSIARLGALMAIVWCSGVVLASGPYSRNQAYAYGIPGYGYGGYRHGSHRVQTGNPALTNGYANPFQQQPSIQQPQQQQMQRTMMKNERLNGGSGEGRP